jgi:3-hydroxyisobutyrate dehydrogenase
MKAFLGTGHLGANFVKAMIAKGEQVQVWNRTAAKARALEAVGAKAFDRVEDAVAGAEVVHLTLKDDSTVDEVLTAALPGLQPGAIIIDHTTTSVQGAVDRTHAWKARGYTYLHAPVFMGPQNALDSTGYMLVSGDQELITSQEPALSKMTGQLINFGTEPGKAAGMKLIGNLFLIAFTGGMADMLSLAKALNIATAEVATLLDAWNPGAAAPARLKKITSGDFHKPTWELHMARKDAGLMMQEAMKKGAKLTVIPVVASEMDHWIGKGHANDDWTVIAKDAIS